MWKLHEEAFSVVAASNVNNVNKRAIGRMA
jgi:hypothetical protein